VKELDNVHIIGHITDVSEGSALVTRDGQEFAIQAQGWTAFARDQK
jgi:thiamine-monophosphate kinase